MLPLHIVAFGALALVVVWLGLYLIMRAFPVRYRRRERP
jgi:hypothetical protein